MLYAMQSGEGAIKVGYVSENTRKALFARRDSLQIGNPEEIRILGVCTGMAKEERSLHKRFASSRRRGEWFDPTRELFDLIKRKFTPLSAVTLRNCGLCGTEFIPRDETEIRCSAVCKRQVYCQHCGKPFTPPARPYCFQNRFTNECER